MLYQLENGQVIHLSIEEYLSISDTELDSLAKCGYGEEASHSFFYGKQLKEKSTIKEIPLDLPGEDDNLDPKNIDLDNIE